MYQSSLGVWEEDVDEESFMNVYQTIIGHLRSRGFRVIKDPLTKKHYKILAPRHHYGVKGLLEADISLSGRHISVEFYQNVVFENASGGRYDFNKIEKMPYLIRQSFLLEMGKIIEMLTNTYGYKLSNNSFGHVDQNLCMQKQVRSAIRGLRPSDNPLASFNATWDSSYDISRGTHRFKRDENTGWPLRTEIGSENQQLDEDGIEMHPGDIRYFRTGKGHIMRGRIYPNMNGMWCIIYGPSSNDVTYLSHRAFFSDPKVDRKFYTNRRARLQKLLAESIRDESFEKSIIFRDLISQCDNLKNAA